MSPLQRLRRRASQSVLRHGARLLGAGEPPRLERFGRRLPKPLQHRLIDTLLFQRSSRPGDARTQARLMQWISQAEMATTDQRLYGTIALAYRAVDLGDADLARRLIPGLESAQKALEGDPELIDAKHTNRQNRAKQRVSIATTLYHLALVIDDRDLALRTVRDCTRALPLSAIDALHPDVACRISSNLMRCHTLFALGCWLRRDVPRAEQTLREMQAFRKVLRETHAEHPRLPFHLDLIDGLLSFMEQLIAESPASSQSFISIEANAALLVRSPNHRLSNRLKAWFSKAPMIRQ